MSGENRKREQAEQLLRALGEIDDRFLMEAMTEQEPADREQTIKQTIRQTGRQIRKRTFHRYSTWALTAAACLAVIVIGRFVGVNSVREGTDTKAPTTVEQRVSEQPSATDSAAEAAAEKEKNEEAGGEGSGEAVPEKTAGDQADRTAGAGAGTVAEAADEEAAVDFTDEAEGLAVEAAADSAEEAAAEAAMGSAAEAAGDSAAEAAMGSAADSAAREPEQPMTAAGAQAVGAGAALTMPNPFTDTKTLEEAEEIAGFSITLPEMGDGNTLIYRAMKDQMIEVICLDEKNTEIYRIRKGKDMEDDISGVYYENAVSDTISAKDLELTVAGEEKGQWEYAVWTEDAEDGTHYSYSILAGKALPAEEYLRMAQEMMEKKSTVSG